MKEYSEKQVVFGFNLICTEYTVYLHSKYSIFVVI